MFCQWQAQTTLKQKMVLNNLGTNIDNVAHYCLNIHFIYKEVLKSSQPDQVTKHQNLFWDPFLVGLKTFQHLADVLNNNTIILGCFYNIFSYFVKYQVAICECWMETFCEYVFLIFCFLSYKTSCLEISDFLCCEFSSSFFCTAWLRDWIYSFPETKFDIFISMWPCPIQHPGMETFTVTVFLGNVLINKCLAQKLTHTHYFVSTIIRCRWLNLSLSVYDNKALYREWIYTFPSNISTKWI